MRFPPGLCFFSYNLPCDHGLDLDASLFCDNSINPINHSVLYVVLEKLGMVDQNWLERICPICC